MPKTDRVRAILSWYQGENPGVLVNLARILDHGALGGTGRLLILPVDQGFEHGPDRSFAPNPAAYDPLYHFGLAIEAGCSAYAAPLGFLEAGAGIHAGEIPLILKCNSSDSLGGPSDPWPAVTAGARDALRLGCAAVGFTIYPGSSHRNEAYGEVRELAREAKSLGLAVVIWSYPRGSGLSKDGETSLDVVAYGAHLAAQLGAHVSKVKPPKDRIEKKEAAAVLEKHPVPTKTLADRVRHVVRCAFDGRRLVVFSGGEAKDRAAILDEVRQIRDGGGHGSIIGRNTFQRPRAEARKLLAEIADILRA